MKSDRAPLTEYRPRSTGEICATFCIHIMEIVMANGFSKRTTKKFENGRRHTTTRNTKTGITTSTSAGNKNRRLTTSFRPDGRVVQTDTIHVQGLGTQRTTRTISSRKATRRSKKANRDGREFAAGLTGQIYIMRFRWFWYVTIPLVLLSIIFA